jgi:hypothetical protein
VVGLAQVLNGDHGHNASVRTRVRARQGRKTRSSRP